jgi:hypothetical protein
MSERDDAGRRYPDPPGNGRDDTTRTDLAAQDTTPGLTGSPSDRTVVFPPAQPAPGTHGAPEYGAPQYGTAGRPGGASPYAQPEYPAGAAGATAPDYSTRPVAVRRPDVLAGLLLLLAGLAAGVSLLLRWLDVDESSGLDLVRRGIDDAAVRFLEPFDTGMWQPLAVVGGGAVLLVLGLLMFLPARRHRFLGLLALVVAGIVTAAVLIPIWREGWDLSPFDLGFWFAIAVAVLGLLGALKALLTGRKYR